MALDSEFAEKTKNWLKDRDNLMLVGIIVFAFVIRLWFFSWTNQQTLWFDEAEYMSTAKKWAFGVEYILNPQRPPLFQLISAVAFMIGLGEIFIRFAFVLLPSTFVVFAVYLLGKEMYDKKVGLIAAFLTAVSWTLLFWGTRVQPDFFSLAFGITALWLMWRYWKENKTNLAVWAAILAALSFYFKVTGLLVPMIIALFILVKDRFDGFKNKDYWLFALAYIVTMIPYFIWSKLTFGTSMAFRSGYSNQVVNDWPFAWGVLDYFSILSGGVLFILFIIGVVLGLKFLLYIDVLIKDKKKVFDPNIFGILALAYIASFYIFYSRGIEDRWIFLWLPFMFFFIANALKAIYGVVKKQGKTLAVIVVLLLLVWGANNQFQHAKSLTESKLGGDGRVGGGGVGIKDDAVVGDSVRSRSKTQNTYYSERFTKSYNDFGDQYEMDKWILENTPKYFVVSVFEPHPEWTQKWVDENIGKLEVKQVYSLDGTNPSLVIYEIKY